MARKRNIKFRDLRTSSKRRPKSMQDFLLEQRLAQVLNAPVKEAESTIIKDIIKSPEKEVKTGQLLDDNIKIDDSDKVSADVLLDILKSPIATEKPTPIVIDVATLAAEEQRRLFEEERERRKIEDERWADITQGFEDEAQRRIDFKKEIQLLKLEFDLYLKEKYPDIVGDKSIKTKEVESTKTTIRNLVDAQTLQKNSIKERMVARIEKEKLRKTKEDGFIINKKEDLLVSTFLEEEIVIEQQEKKDRNPELDGLNSVEKQIKDMKLMEKKLGRPIIPHRDIIESEESDFDTDTETDSNDILIREGGETPFENYKERREPLERLRKSLNGEDTEEDFIVKQDKLDRKSGI